MADVLSRVETVDNAGATVATFGANAYKHRISQSDAGRELVVKIASSTTINDAELSAAISEITRSQGSVNHFGSVQKDIHLNTLRKGFPDLFHSFFYVGDYFRCILTF